MKHDLVQQISKKMYAKFVDHSHVLQPHNSERDFDWIHTQSGLPWLELDVKVPYNLIYQELENIRDLLVEHRDDYAEHSGWKSFCIHGKSYNSTREDQHYKDDRPHIWTPEAKERMPNTVDYFQTMWPGSNYKRLRVMFLEAGGIISIHRDSETSRLSAINIAITNPVDCKFVMENHGAVPFAPGRAFWLDIHNRHTIINNSPEPRWHIIVHQDFSSNFQELVLKSYDNLYKNFQ